MLKRILFLLAVLPVLALAEGQPEVAAVSTSVTSARSAKLSTGWKWVVCTVNTHYQTGNSAVTATTSDFTILAAQAHTIIVTPAERYVAFILDAGTGSCSIYAQTSSPGMPPARSAAPPTSFSDPLGLSFLTVSQMASLAAIDGGVGPHSLTGHVQMGSTAGVVSTLTAGRFATDAGGGAGITLGADKLCYDSDCFVSMTLDPFPALSDQLTVGTDSTHQLVVAGSAGAPAISTAGGSDVSISLQPAGAGAVMVMGDAGVSGNFGVDGIATALAVDAGHMLTTIMQLGNSTSGNLACNAGRRGQSVCQNAGTDDVCFTCTGSVWRADHAGLPLSGVTPAAVEIADGKSIKTISLRGVGFKVLQIEWTTNKQGVADVVDGGMDNRIIWNQSDGGTQVLCNLHVPCASAVGEHFGPVECSSSWNNQTGGDGTVTWTIFEQPCTQAAEGSLDGLVDVGQPTLPI